MKRLATLVTAVGLAAPQTASAVQDDELIFQLQKRSARPVARADGEGPNHPEIGDHAELVRALQRGRRSVQDVRRLGLSVFSTPFNTRDGYGDGPFDSAEPGSRAPGERPTLQGNGTLLRVNGLDAQSCNECHSILSAATRPPTLGIAGVGGSVTNAIIAPTLIDVADSEDDRVAWEADHDPDLPVVVDGVADFSGRFANPPFLFGGGAVELLAKEMTADLQQALADARGAPAGAIVDLETHGVSFGFLRSLGGGDVDLDGVEGVGPLDIDAVAPESALVVRPFGRKGENFSMRDFDRGAMQFHFGIQPVEVVGAGVDADGDAVVDEVTVGEMTALHVFDVTNPPPFIARLGRAARRGFETFRALGCADCHRPLLRTRERSLPLAHPELDSDPDANVYARIDLLDVGFAPAPGGGLLVPLFADLKRHDMGDRLAETFELDAPEAIGNRRFTTARLWGVADTAPYLHDGRATTLSDAIELHGGEAQDARDGFVALSDAERSGLIAFLSRLRVPERPNEDLLVNR